MKTTRTLVAVLTAAAMLLAACSGKPSGGWNPSYCTRARVSAATWM